MWVRACWLSSSLARDGKSSSPVPFGTGDFYCKLDFIAPCAVDNVGAAIGRPCREMLRILRKPMQIRNTVPLGVLQSAANQNRSIAGGNRTIIHGSPPLHSLSKQYDKLKLKTQPIKKRSISCRVAATRPCWKLGFPPPRPCRAAVIFLPSARRSPSRVTMAKP